MTMFYGARPKNLKPLTKRERKSGKISEVWVEADRWFDARAFAQRCVDGDVKVAATDKEPPKQAYQHKKVFRLEWVGQGGSQINPSRLLVHEVQKK
jgi:hypothetical protein